MHGKPTPSAAIALASILTVFAAGPAALAQGPTDIPPSVRMEHESVLGYLHHIAERTTPSGKAAQQLIEVLTKHMANEEAFILPPLTLLPALSKGKVTPDMRWALVMSDKVAAEQDNLRRTHAGITEAILALQDAAEQEHDEITVGFSRDLAADDLGDVEVTEPTVLMIGEMLRMKLPAQ